MDNDQPAPSPLQRKLECSVPPGGAVAPLPAEPWSRPWEDVCAELDVAAELGLPHGEVLARRERYGANCLTEAKQESAWLILVNQFRGLIVLLLAVAVLVSFLSGALVEGFAVVAVLLINAAIGFFTEVHAVRSMEALRELGTVPATVRRQGQLQVVTSEELVPGDILVLEAGQVLGADARLLSVSQLQADESALTGESAPVTKQLAPVAAGVTLADRTSMVWRGTALTRGSGEAVVTATGVRTELGQVSELVAQASKESTPLERRLEQLGQRLVWVTLVIAVVVIALGILQGRDLLLMVQTGIALAVATIPEGLPIVATTSLARGMWRMAKRNALMNRLSAVETLGATSVIGTDKTGTLTENRMTVRRVLLPDAEVAVEGGAFETTGSFVSGEQQLDPAQQPLLAEALRLGALCNTAALREEPDQRTSGAVGDPLEIALLVAAARASLERPDLLRQHPVVYQHAFDAETKMMATYHQEPQGLLVAVKGAPEQVLPACSRLLTADGEQPLDDQGRAHWMAENERLAGTGLRMLAVARKTAGDQEEPPYQDLTLVGLMGLMDPPREDAAEALRLAHEAGIRVIMMTGDQAGTAAEVAKAVGLVAGEAGVVTGAELRPEAEWSEEDRERLVATTIFARVSPRQKLDLIDLHQQRGQIVGMTGDGVNDAPALKKADIGIAMGLRGTQVAREAADMILLDDAFASIVFAIEQGRVIFRNIRRFVVYLLSCNVAEIMTVTLASLVNAPLPILPLQILFLNLVTDVFPAMALGVGESEEGVMQRPPRPANEPVLAGRHWRTVALFGFIITVAVLGSLALALLWLHLPQPQAITVSFLTLALAQLWHVFNLRDPAANWWRNDIVQSKYIWGAVALCVALLAVALYVPAIAHLLHLEHIGPKAVGLAFGMSLLPLLAGQAIILPLRRK